MDTIKLYGPPGTGKTYRGLQWMERQVTEGGCDPRRVAFVSFTNAAVNEARVKIQERFGLDADELPYCRTLHSLCKRALGVGGRGGGARWDAGSEWLADRKLAAFAKEFGYDLRADKKSGVDDNDLENLVTKKGRDAGNLQVWEFARQRLIEDPQVGWQAFAEYSPDDAALLRRQEFVQFVTDYEVWKGREGLRDYTDLLTDYLASSRQPLPVSCAIVDEAQDLTPCMWAVADALFADAECRATLGDDDQSIYSHSGAAPELMNGREAHRKVKLKQSFRLPRTIVDVARRIIGQNQNREPKETEPVPGVDGEVSRILSLRDVDVGNGESWFLLVRNWKLTDQFTTHLEGAGIPYLMGGGRYTPWSDLGPYRAVRVIHALACGESVLVTDLLPLVDRTATETKDKPGTWIRGAKTDIKALIIENTLAAVSAPALYDFGMTQWGLERVLREDLSLLSAGISERDRDAYYAAARAGTLLQVPRVRVSSIHSVKGQEADNVVVLMGCTGGTFRALTWEWRREEERRVAYVAATRAKKRLFGMQAMAGRGVLPWELMGI